VFVADAINSESIALLWRDWLIVHVAVVTVTKNNLNAKQRKSYRIP